jgi:hypothetical protein
MTPRRPHALRSLPAALGLASLLALTGCGATDAGAVSQGESAGPTPSSEGSASSDTTGASGATETSDATGATESATPDESAPTQPAPAGTDSPGTAPQAPPTESGPPRLIGYAGGESPGAEIHDQADADRLQGAPEGFKQFIGRTAERLAHGSTCTDGYVGVTVETLRTDGYAVGGVNECGGYRALWAVVDGSWKEVAASQEMWDCAVLEHYTVPSDIAGERCYDYDAQKDRRYQQA